MGDWEYYCALCAASFSSHVDEETLEEANNINFLNPLFSWLDTLQVVGENPDASSLSCCYISGSGRSDYYGTAHCSPSDDPNCPSADGGSERFAVDTYYNYAEEQEKAIPMHRKCLDVFVKVLAREKGTTSAVNPDILFGAMREKRKGKGLRCLNINYFELDGGKGEQYFLYTVEALPFLLDPINIPAMVDYAAAMPLLQSRSDANVAEPLSRTFHDPFSNLPPEILNEILLTLPMLIFTPFRTASPAARRLQLAPSFWRKRIETHMPWSWEVIAHAAQTEELYDWAKIHNDLESFSKPDKTKGDKLPLGFANRRRIYNVCQGLGRRYIQLENEIQSTLPKGDAAQMLQSAKCMHFVGVSNPTIPEFNSVTKFMLPQWSDIATERKTLEISWNSSGTLAGIALTIRGVRSAIEGDVKAGISTDTLVIEEGDWIDGFLFFMTSPEPKINGVSVRTLRSPAVTFGSTSETCLRLMAVDNGNVFVGLKAVVIKDAVVRLGILECPLPSSIDLPSLPKVDAATSRMVWKNAIPPPDVHAIPFHVGYNNYGTEATENNQIMHPLIFGASEDQLSAFTGLAVSADFLGFFAYHNNAEPSFIGVSQGNLKYFPVDGPRGERIVKVSLGIGSGPVGLKVLTNRGRQGIFGMLRSGSCTVFDYTGPTTNHNIAGIYGSFERRNPQASIRLTCLGALYSPSIDPPTIPATPDAWDPSPPPAHWRSEEPIYGSNEHYALCYLDLTKPIAKISGLLAAPDEYHIIELGGFVVTYIDGSTCYLGTPTDLWAGIKDVAAVSALQRHKNMSSSFGQADEGLTSHVTTAEAVEQNRDGACWYLGPSGDLISSVTVWAGKYLNGIQFHSADGRVSPRWGKCGQREAAVITTGAAAAKSELDIPTHVNAVGVKFYLESHRDLYNAPDARPVGLQVLMTDI